jgi:hypothetical protein
MMAPMPLKEHVRRAYATFDPRSIALGRIVLASVLLLDLAKRWVGISTWYTNEGLLPNHTLLWRPTFQWVFSFFYMVSYRHEAVIAFLGCALVYLALLLGYRTRLAHVLAAICVVSLHGRVLFIQNGGDVVLSELCLWTMFLPTGRRFSIDALRERLRRAEPAPPDTRPVVSLVVTAMILQLAVIYLFNAIHKGGPTWRQGNAVHYVLHQNRIVTTLGVWAREHLGAGPLRVMTWTALGIEWTLPVMLLSPIGTRHTRRIAILLVWMLHTGFALFLNLGVFVPAMIAYTPNLLPGADWDALERWWARRRRPAIVERASTLLLRLARLTLSFDPTLPTPGAPRSPRRGLAILRELTIGGLIVLAGSQLMVENYAIRRLIAIKQPQVAQAAILYMQLFQGWSMFAPDAPTGDMNMYVEAVTSDGRRVDPFSEEASPRYPAPWQTIPPRLDQNSFFCDYLTRIAGRGEYHQAFIEWILRYPERTGRPADRIVSFEAFTVEHDSPRPGELTPSNTRTHSFLKYPR